MEAWFGYRNGSFKFVVETFNLKINKQEKMDLMEKLDFLGWEGPINLTNPEHTFYYVEYYGIDPNYRPEKPYQVYFGRYLSSGMRSMIDHLSLKKRKFIANTTMDPTLSLVMANLAEVKSNDLIYDPFIGTGSIALAAAKFGGYCLGADIDYKLLHGMSKPTRAKVQQRDPDESVEANFKQYGLESKYIDVLVADASLHSMWSPHVTFDAIITDPPYGIRESTERIGTEKEDPSIPEHCKNNHYPSKLEYNLCDILRDLLNFAAKHLTTGGHLVYWLPVVKGNGFEIENQIPRHRNLELLSWCEQPWTQLASRLLVCMRKRKIDDPNGTNACDDLDETVGPLPTLKFREIYFSSSNTRLPKNSLLSK